MKTTGLNYASGDAHCYRQSRFAPLLHFFSGIVCLSPLFSASTVSAQGFPSKPIRLVTAEAGGGNDFSARLVAQGLTASLGQQVVIENRPSGVIPINVVAKAPADGYTLLYYGSIVWILPLLQDNLTYDPVKDFMPITLIATQPNILVVHPSLPVRYVKDLIALALARPGQLNYASSSTGSTTHLATELFKSMANINIVRIAYKGSGPAVNNTISGEVQLLFATAGSVVPHVNSARLRALGITSARPSALFPELPTVAASVPGYESGSIHSVFAPARTPAQIVNRLQVEIVRVLGAPDIKSKMFNAGLEIVGSTPQQLDATMKLEMTALGNVIKNAGIRAE